jgi:hypothetical protein
MRRILETLDEESRQHLSLFSVEMLIAAGFNNVQVRKGGKSHLKHVEVQKKKQGAFADLFILNKGFYFVVN